MRKKDFLIDWIAVPALLLALCVWLFGSWLKLNHIPISPANDLAKHVAMALNFAQAVQNGQYFPRLQLKPAVAPDIPLFQYYGFLEGAVAFPFLKLGLSGLHAVTLAAVLSRWLSIFTLYLTARLLGARRPVCLIVSTSYLFSPYLISTWYGRAAVAEFHAHSILPFLLLGWIFLKKQKPFWGIATLSVTVCLLALSHNIFLLYGVVLLLIPMFFCNDASIFCGISLSILAGLSLSSLQWLPAFVSGSDLAVKFVGYPYGVAGLTSLWGLVGLPRPLTPAGEASRYFFTLGWWTIPAFLGLILSKERLRNYTRPLLAAGLIFFLLSWSPVDFWAALPRVLWSVQFPYRLLSFVSVIVSMSIAVSFPQMRNAVSTVVILLIIVSQLRVVQVDLPGAHLSMTDEKISEQFASLDFRSGSPSISSFASADGWLNADNEITIPHDPQGSYELVLQGETGFADEAIQIYAAEPAMRSKPLSDPATLMPGPFSVAIKLPEFSPIITLSSSRYFVPSDKDPTSSDGRSLSIRLSSADVVPAGGWHFVPFTKVRIEEKHGYTRTYRLVGGEFVGADKKRFRVELPLAYNRFFRVYQKKQLRTFPNLFGRTVVEMESLSGMLMTATYETPTICFVLTVLGTMFVIFGPYIHRFVMGALSTIRAT